MAATRGIIRALAIIACTALGVVVGAMATVVRAGPVDHPLLGILLALAMVFVAVALSVECSGRYGGLGFVVALMVTTVWLASFHSSGDQLFWAEQRWSEIWAPLAFASSTMSLYWFTQKRDTSRVRQHRRESASELGAAHKNEMEQ